MADRKQIHAWSMVALCVASIVGLAYLVHLLGGRGQPREEANGLAGFPGFKRIRQISAAGDEAHTMAISSNGDFVAWASYSAEVVVADTESGTVRHRFPVIEGKRTFCFGKEGTVFYLHEPGVVSAYRCGSWERIARFRLPGAPLAFEAMECCPDSGDLVLNLGPEAIRLSGDRLAIVSKFPLGVERGRYRRCRPVPRSSRFAVVLFDRLPRDPATIAFPAIKEEEARPKPVALPISSIMSLSPSLDGDHIAITSSESPEVVVWDRKGSTVAGRILLPAHGYKIEYFHDGKLIWVTTSGKIILLLKAQPLSLAATLSFPTKVAATALCVERRWVAVALNSGVIIVGELEP